MIKIILITILVIIPAIAVAEGKEHTGRFCAACHAVVSCSNDCHASDDSEPSYIGRHVNPSICSRCHGEQVKNPDIHAIHGKKICSTCHSSEGWNSTIAKIPPSESSDSMVIPKSKQCSYCHGFNNDRRLHGIHRPFLVEEKCPKCHGDVSPTREEILRVTGKEPRASNTSLGSIGINPEVKEIVMTPINILTDFFNRIANTWMEILNF
ncbi:molecular chaperone DnaJ [Candidatus Methanoperedens nitratireducens]|uniref:Uncharacterized protein n=1 Tax=Candidatus Methanoperedens nitratireducens TaxID=1392998 RepID=A0A284VJL4_9EURY|nr:hypothetical protein [Candidatus Methanoperedens nitroreducens]SNQ59379.1 hypothetical protein MNV_1170010 [Candidatus Methanoperedens nitroreducens]